MAKYTLPVVPPFRPALVNQNELSGEDIMLTDKLEISAGDWRTISGADAAEQSVRREASANTGALLRRPAWGMGVTQALFQSATKTVGDNIITRVRNRMQLNPRVGRFISADIIKLTSVSGSAVSIKYEPIGVKQPKTTVIKGNR